MKMSMVDGLGGVNTRQRALPAVQLANLKLHCRRRVVWAEEHRPVVDWGKWAAGPQRLLVG